MKVRYLGDEYDLVNEKDGVATIRDAHGQEFKVYSTYLQAV